MQNQEKFVFEAAGLIAQLQATVNVFTGQECTYIASGHANALLKKFATLTRLISEMPKA